MRSCGRAPLNMIRELTEFRLSCKWDRAVFGLFVKAQCGLVRAYPENVGASSVFSIRPRRLEVRLKNR